MLELKNISLNYGTRQILQNLSCCFYPKINVLTGENGSGKTSLLNIIAGQSAEYKGQLIYRQQTPDPRRIAYCRQFMADAFFTGSVEEEVAYTIEYSGSDKSVSQIWQQLEMLGLKRKTCADQSPFFLDQNEQKLLSFALSVIKDYDILLLDETDSGLSFGFKKLLAGFIKTISDKIIIVISHDIWFINQLQTNSILQLQTGGVYKCYADAQIYFKSLNITPERLNLLLNKENILKKITNY